MGNSAVYSDTFLSFALMYCEKLFAEFLPPEKVIKNMVETSDKLFIHVHIYHTYYYTLCQKSFNLCYITISIQNIFIIITLLEVISQARQREVDITLGKKRNGGSLK